MLLLILHFPAYSRSTFSDCNTERVSTMYKKLNGIGKLSVGYYFLYVITIMIIKYATNKCRNVDICLHVSMFSDFSMQENQMKSLLKHRFLRNYPRASGRAGLSCSLRVIFNKLPDVPAQSVRTASRGPPWVVGTP